MRLLSLFFLTFFFAVSSQAQQFNIELRNASAEAVIKEIQQQSYYRFVYTKEQLEGLPTVTVKLRNASLDKVLRSCFNEQYIEWKVDGNAIVLKRKSPRGRDPLAANGTQQKIRGRVVNEAGEGLEGVTIESSKQLTVSGPDGSFSLDGKEGDAVTFSYVGYVKRQLPPGDNMVVEMKQQGALLDETVVIAYGTTTRKLNTGSVSSVKAVDLERSPVSNPLAVLQGRVPGLEISQRGGLPGAGFNVLVRGRNSIQNGVSPLIIIDGVPFIAPDEQLMQRGSFNANSPFATINPKDIERIEVLKDADATAIYGSRGANGVILITTKGAKKYGNAVGASVYVGVGKQTRVLPYMGLQDYLTMRREAFKNDGVAMTIANAPDLLLWDTTREINWRKEVLGESVQYFNASVTYEAGGENLRFALRSNYNAESAVFPGEFGSKGANVSMTTTYRPKNGKFGSEFGSGYAYQKTLLPLRNMGEFMNLPPHAMELYDSAGNYNWSEGGANFLNPMAVLEQKHLSVTQRISLTERLWWQITPMIEVSLRGGMNNIWFNERTSTPILAQRPSASNVGSANFGTNQITNWSIEPQLEFKKTIAKGLNLNILAGLSLQGTDSKISNIAGAGYTNDALLGTIGGAGIVTATNDKSVYRYQAVFSRVGMQWKERYLLNLTGRRDGSSRFGPNKRFANFGSIGAGWIFSKENWFEQLKIISFGKLRGSYGITGNDQIRNYQFLDSWVSSSLPYQGMPVIRPNKLFNPNYSWEQIRKKELALELGLMKDRIFATVNYFESRSDNQIVNYPLPSQTGFSSILKNFPGVVENKGFEVLLETVNLKRDELTWRSSLNISFPKNRLLEFPVLEKSSYANSLRIGKSLNSSIGYVYSGLDEEKGIYSFKDINNDGVYDINDKVWIGSTDPTYYGGVINHFEWKGIELSFLFEFKKQIGNNPFLTGGTAGRMVNVPKALLDRWQEPGGGGQYQIYSQQSGSAAASSLSLMSESSGRLVNASYVRFKNVHIGYNLPKRTISKMKMRQVQVYMEAQNLFTWTDFAGADPENQGLLGISPLRVITGGLNIQF